jgi:hypothetical protein
MNKSSHPQLHHWASKAKQFFSHPQLHHWPSCACRVDRIRQPAAAELQHSYWLFDEPTAG